jgi:hypothetical protein
VDVRVRRLRHDAQRARLGRQLKKIGHQDILEKRISLLGWARLRPRAGFSRRLRRAAANQAIRRGRAANVRPAHDSP